MINAEHRSLLTDALTPPPGFTFDSGVATTFSLDLVTLLTLPLHLAWLGTTDGGAEVDPLPVLEALRRTADRLTVFCHAGRLQIPRAASPLLGLMEGMVHEAVPRHGGAFHPKVWVLRFTAAGNSPVTRLRLLVLSRNLTDDRSWDLSLNLDGEVGRAKVASNRPLVKFLAHAQTLSRKPVLAHRQQDMQRLMDDVHRCGWELPTGFDVLRFHPLGIESRPQAWLPRPEAGRWDEFGVISPFVAADALQHLSRLSSRPLFLVCCPDEMDKLPSFCEACFEKTLVLNTQAETSDQEDDVDGRLSGLHAKVFVGKRGWNTHLFVGSANATNAALLRGQNVEFVAELIGRASKVQRPADWLRPQGIGDLLEPYARSEPVQPEDERQIALRLDALREQLVAGDLRLRCAAAQQGWTLWLCSGAALELGGIALRVWPLSLSPERAVSWPAGMGLAGDDSGLAALELGTMAEQDLTAFCGFGLKLGQQELAFALNLPIDGLPEGRDLSILRAALGNRDGFVRYLLLLLGHWGPQGGSPRSDPGAIGGGGRRDQFEPVALFEMLTRAFSREPERLLRVRQVLERLGAEASQEIVPAEFHDMWRAFEQAIAEDMAP